MDENHGLTCACGAIAQPPAIRADEGHILHSTRIAAGIRGGYTGNSGSGGSCFAI
jgi:hypothetical protein